MEGLTMSTTTSTDSNPTRNHKSSEKLHRLNAHSTSSTNLSSKRSKSYTNTADAHPTSSKARRNPNSTSRTKLSTLSSERRKSTTQLHKKADQDEDQGGWTSTSESSTPSQSLANSPDLKSSSTVIKKQEDIDEREGRGRGQRSDIAPEVCKPNERMSESNSREEEQEEDEEDEGLTMNTKRRGRLSNTKHIETQDEAAPKSASRDPPTPKASSRQLDDSAQEQPQTSTASISTTSASNVLSPKSAPQNLSDSVRSVKSDGSDGTLAQAEETSLQGEASSVLSGTETLNNSSVPNPPTLSLPSTSLRPPLDHRDSSATLRHNPGPGHSRAAGSPSSTRSRTSIRTRAPIPSRDSFSNSTGVAPPKLDTHYALVGALGALHEDRASNDDDLMSNRFSTSPRSDRRLSINDGRLTGSLSAPQGWQESSNDVEPYLIGSSSRSKRKASVGSVGSNINVSTAGPSTAGVSKASITRHDDDPPGAASSGARRRRGESSEPGTGNSTWNDYTDTIRPRERDARVRTTSTQSLGAADAARLAAKLRLARDGPEERSFSASQSNSSTSAAANALSRAGSAVGLSSLALSSTTSNPRSNMISSRNNEETNKPAVSTFSRNERKAPEPIIVRENSIYHPMFSHAVKSGEDVGKHGDLTVRSKKDGRIQAGKGMGGEGKQKVGAQVRYLLDYGLSGPPLTPSTLNDALLAPSFSTDEFDASWAPALANAAGLGLRNSSSNNHNVQQSHQSDQNNVIHARAGKSAAFAASAADFSHGNDADQLASSLDLETRARLNSEMLASGTALANGPNASPLHFVHGLTSTSEDDFPLEEGELPRGLLFDGSSGVSINGTTRNIDPKTMRAIALTSHALAVARSHTVTRRFRDPMRESLNRVVKESGHWPGQLTSVEGSHHLHRRSNPSSPNINSHGFSLSRTSSSDSRRPNLNRSHTGSNSNMPPSDTIEQPLQSLKRVWSGGLHRGGLAALTRTSSQAGGNQK